MNKRKRPFFDVILDTVEAKTPLMSVAQVAQRVRDEIRQLCEILECSDLLGHESRVASRLRRIASGMSGNGIGDLTLYLENVAMEIEMSA